MKVICDIFKSPNEDEMYLYVKKEEGLDKVPEALLDKFGKPQHVMTMLLTPEKKLGRADAARVLEQLEDPGFYLQMPPPKDDEMRRINAHNTKINLF
ncbi:YcgL domain-containing protein [Candidatus Pelagadaptatus aseana]|uniref:YcgL domain-containing protein n=1 Tax=Candidatus Pelagadaptatus aseana TaxID=3120508 RepID=UPI003C702A90